jgi:hypothetical protein
LDPIPSSEYYPGQGTTIHWNSISVDSIKIDYSINNGNTWIPIATRFPAKWSYFNWSIPNFPQTQGLVRIMDFNNSNIGDTISSSIFIKNYLPNPSSTKYKGGNFDGYAIKSNSTDSLNLLTLGGGENIESKQQIAISWFANNLDLLKLEYSIDSGNTWVLIANNISATSSPYNWSVPSIFSSKCFFKF